MKKIYRNKLSKAVGMVCSLLLLASCSDWNDHYDPANIVTGDIDVYNGDVASYIKSEQKLSNMAKVYSTSGILDNMKGDMQYTLIVADNDVLDMSQIENINAFAKYTVSDAAVEPSLLTDGYGIKTQSGKSLWVAVDGSTVKLDKYNIVKTVKANNGYIYYVNGTLKVRKSVYEYLNALPEGDNPETSYTLFKNLVKQYEERWFDRESSRVTGVNAQGQTVYDSVFVQRNTLMDRYSEDGIKAWDMFDEQYNTTMFIPNDAQVKAAIDTACDSIPSWLNRQPTAADTAKFEKWIVEAAFVNSKLSDNQLCAGNDSIIAAVGLYKRVEDKVNDIVEYKTETSAYWNPSVNTVNVSGKEELSNGVAYYTNTLHIPNHIVIYRVKSRFYELWNNMTSDQREAHFTWTNWQNPYVVNDAQGSFFLVETWPEMFYHVLTAEPTKEAINNSLECGVVYDGTYYDEETGSIFDVTLPKGEYYLRMGFKHSLTYSISIYFRTKGLNPLTDREYPWQEMKKDMVLYAQGSNFHFDRGAASEVPHYGEDGISYPEGFDVDYWQKYNEKAIAYDTDGYTVGKVNIEKNGNFEIKITSSDNARLYKYSVPDNARTKNNIQQLMMYHWCLRPTKNNY